MADSEILARVRDERDLVFVTQDDDFAGVMSTDGGAVSGHGPGKGP